MSWLVVVNLGGGSLAAGCPEVSAQLFANTSDTESAFPVMQLRGSLPPAPELERSLRYWRLLYRELYRVPAGTRALEIADSGITHVSEVEFRDLCTQIQQQLDEWLNADSFREIDRRLSRLLGTREEIRFAIATDDPDLRRLPWHLWNFFADYPHAEVVLSSLEYVQEAAPPPTPSGSVRILGIFGNSAGIDLESDRRELETLPGAEAVFLDAPDRASLGDRLWETPGWDLLFFAGHSDSEGEDGRLWLNSQEDLSLSCLERTLRSAIARGLKLAIFNSCDGLGLARSLSDLPIPYVIVMREPVPDAVAQEFFRQFVRAFARGKSLHVAVREARDRLEKLEGRYPCATWLPVICQHPATPPATWQNWQGIPQPMSAPATAPTRRKRWQAALALGAAGIPVVWGVQAVWNLLNPLELLVMYLLSRGLELDETPPPATQDAESETPESSPVLSVRYADSPEAEDLQRLLEGNTLNIEELQAIANAPSVPAELERLRSGRYELRVQLVNAEGKTVTYQMSVEVDLDRPAVLAFPNLPREPLTQPLDAIDVRFSEAIDPESFDPSDISLKRPDATEVSTLPEVTIEQIDPERYRIRGLAPLTEAPGEYRLGIDAEGIADRAGNAGNARIEANFTRTDTSAPTFLPSESLLVELLVPSDRAPDPDEEIEMALEFPAAAPASPPPSSISPNFEISTVTGRPPQTPEPNSGVPTTPIPVRGESFGESSTLDTSVAPDPSSGSLRISPPPTTAPQHEEFSDHSLTREDSEPPRDRLPDTSSDREDAFRGVTDWSEALRWLYPDRFEPEASDAPEPREATVPIAPESEVEQLPETTSDRSGAESEPEREGETGELDAPMPGEMGPVLPESLTYTFTRGEPDAVTQAEAFLDRLQSPPLSVTGASWWGSATLIGDRFSLSLELGIYQDGELVHLERDRDSVSEPGDSDLELGRAEGDSLPSSIALLGNWDLEAANIGLVSEGSLPQREPETEGQPPAGEAYAQMRWDYFIAGFPRYQLGIDLYSSQGEGSAIAALTGELTLMSGEIAPTPQAWDVEELESYWRAATDYTARSVSAPADGEIQENTGEAAIAQIWAALGGEPLSEDSDRAFLGEVASSLLAPAWESLDSNASLSGV